MESNVFVARVCVRMVATRRRHITSIRNSRFGLIYVNVAIFLVDPCGRDE